MVIGTDEDPQDIQSQIDQLEDAGVTVFRTATEAVEYISLRFGSDSKYESIPVDLDAIETATCGHQCWVGIVLRKPHVARCTSRACGVASACGWE